jgi:hypothetical protein
MKMIKRQAILLMKLLQKYKEHIDDATMDDHINYLIDHIYEQFDVDWDKDNY